jgi:Fur family transcriptional regulator, ferric uptake regulator
MYRHHSHAPAAADAATLLKQATDRARQSGLRRTRALEDVLRMLIDAHRPLTLGDIAESSQLKSGADRATVYRLLMKLEERGIIRRLGLHDRSAYYVIIYPGAHNDFLICTKCGTIEKLDIACPVEKLENQIARQSGFSKLYHELEFFGLCPQCG